MPAPAEDNSATAQSNFRWMRMCFLGGLAAYLLIFTWVSLGRTLWYSPDSYFYIEVATNLAAGKGLAHSVLVISSLEEDTGLKRPLREWAPGYPALIALGILLGIHPGYGALLISAAGLAGMLAALWFLLRRLYDESVAAVAISCLLLYLPTIFVFRHAWSEGPSMAFFCAGLALLVLSRNPGTALLSGLAIGAACAIRYAFLPALLLGPLVFFAACARQRWRSADRTKAQTDPAADPLVRSLAWGLGASGVLVPLVLTNVLRTGHPFGAARPVSTVGFATNLSDAWGAITAGYMSHEWLSAAVQAKALLVILLGILLVAVLRRNGGQLLRDYYAEGRWIIPAWALLFLGFMLLTRTFVEMDRLGPRLLFSGLVPLVILFAVFVVRGLGLQPRTTWPLAQFLLVAALAWQVHDLVTLQKDSLVQRVANSERLQWITAHTTPEDLIVGDTLFDVPLYCGPRQVLCGIPSADPAQHVQREALAQYLTENRCRYAEAYIVLRKAAPAEPWAQAQWRQYYGDFFTDLVYGGQGEELEDAYVFSASDLARLLDGK